MSINPSPLNISVLPSFISYTHKCFNSTISTIIFTSFTLTSIFFLLPLFILVLYLGLQRWRQGRSVSAATASSHSDLFTYHMVVMELIGFLGCGIYYCSILSRDISMPITGIKIFCVVIPGQFLFHCLTCVERYLAVVHPITYLSLRKARGIRIRNISIGCVWLLSFVLLGLLSGPFPIMAFLFFLAFFFVVTSFCSLAVLRALIRPRLREVGGTREPIDPLKLRAFFTIMSIMGVLLVRFLGFLLFFGMSHFGFTGTDFLCVLFPSVFWLSVPSSLVLPLLFLHRAGKLVCCRYNTESG